MVLSQPENTASQGGLIISTALAHLLAEAVEADTSYPWGCVLAGVGYLLMASIETVTAFIMNKSNGRGILHSTDGYTELRTYCPFPNSQESVHDGEINDADEMWRGHVRCVPMTPLAWNSAPFGRHTPVGGSLVTAFALTLHSIGDGIAIAAQATRGKVTAVGLAVLAHKFFASYALGSMFKRASHVSSTSYFYMFAFILATPLSILLIVFVGASLQRQAMRRATAVCSGMLLHVCVHEIMAPHIESPQLSPFAKLVSLWVGFAIMSALAIWV